MGFGDDFLSFFGKVGSKIENAIGKVFDFDKGVVNQIVGTPAKLITTAGDAVKNLSTAAQNIGTSVSTAVSSSVGSIAAVLPDVSKNVGSALTSLGGDLQLPLIAAAVVAGIFFLKR